MISSFYTIVPKTTIICNTVPEIWRMADVIVIFHFGLFFALLPPNSPKNKNNKKKKMKKTTRRYHHFTHVYQKLWLDDVQFLRYGARQMDRRMDRQKKWHIEVAAPPKKTKLLTERKFWCTYFTKKCLKRSGKRWSPFANYNSLHHSSIKKFVL